MIIPWIIVILAPLAGGLVVGFERILRARMQNRIGPSLLQPFHDFFKLLDKRPSIVHSTHAVLGIFHFVASWVALAALVFGTDLFIVLFLHLLSTCLLVLAGFSTKSIFSHLGSSRLAISIVASEPILALIFVAIYQATGSFDASVAFQSATPLIYKLPLAFAGLLVILPILLHKSPFDVTEAHQEIVGGPEIEFSGVFYEALYTAKWLDYIFVFTLVFMFGGSNYIIGATLVFFTFILVNAVDNATARVNYSQMMKITLGVGVPLTLANLVFVAL